MPLYSLSQFGADLRRTLRMAAGYALVATIGFGLLGVLVLTGRPLTSVPAATFSTVVGALGVFVLVYMVGATGSAVVIFLLRPLRRSSIGWAVTGALVTLLCYGALVGFMQVFSSTLTWLFALRGISETGSEGEGWGLFILLATFAAPIGAAAGLWFYDEQRSKTT